MKVPLRYQITEYDCGPTSMLNAISFLFEREDIPPDIAKYIMLYCLDSYNGKGEYAKSGTSQMAMMFLSSWLNQFSKTKKFPISCKYLFGDEVKISRDSQIVSALQQGGCAVIRLYYDCWHYVLLTGVSGDSIEMFDPYYRRRPFVKPGIELIDGFPASKNRLVNFSFMECTAKTHYSLGAPETREAVIMFNQTTRKTPEKTIEYFL